MDSQLPTIKPHFLTCFVLLALLCVSFSAFAGEEDMDFFGMTIHLHKKGYVQNAPLKLDDPGKVVFNPGVGLGYDFRDDIHTGGFSPEIHGGFFENCDNHPYTFLGAGMRYRKFFHKKYFWETNLLVAATYGNDSIDKHYRLDATPYLNVGLGRDYGKYLVTYYLSYIPKGSDGGITSSTDMIFLSAAISF